jgi:hypothetical protein
MDNMTYLYSSWRRNMRTFLWLGTIGLAMRAAAFGVFQLPAEAVSLARTDLAVYIEHFLAGVGVPAGILGVLVFFMWTAERSSRKPPSPRRVIDALFIFCLLFASIGYLMHMLAHELEQAFVAVYGGPAYGAVQQGQVFIGLVGILLFTVKNWSHWREWTQNRGLS